MASMGSLGGLVSGLVGSSGSLPTVDISALLNTINSSGAYQKQLIDQLPDQVKQQLADYAASNTAAGNTYQGNILAQGNNYLATTAGLYGPDSAAANAQKDADRAAIYSTVPGTQDAIRNAMAASGGLTRGSSGVALAQPYLQAAQQYGNAAMKTDATQTAAGQNAMQQALQTVNSMNDTMFQNMFGMSKQQAQQILTTGNQALSTQLSDLINQSQNQTNQTLSAQGIAVNNGYQNAVTRNAQQNAIWSGLINSGLQVAGAEDQSGGAMNPFSGEGSVMNNWSKLMGGSGGATGGADSMGADGRGASGAGSTILPAALSLI